MLDELVWNVTLQFFYVVIRVSSIGRLVLAMLLQFFVQSKLLVFTSRC
jgi:hypothetical protein